MAFGLLLAVGEEDSLKQQLVIVSYIPIVLVPHTVEYVTSF
jgi:hypothetical protein